MANQWLDLAGGYAGYHGDWAENFKLVDRHLGSLDDYRALSHALHSRGVYLVQDIVVNHTGNFFSYGGGWQRADPGAGYEPHALSPPVARPSQHPFDRNDLRDPAQRSEGIYHWTPDVADYTDRNQELNFQKSGLDDLNTESPVLRRALRDSFGHWIREAVSTPSRADGPPPSSRTASSARWQCTPGRTGCRPSSTTTTSTAFWLAATSPGCARPCWS